MLFKNGICQDEINRVFFLMLRNRETWVIEFIKTGSCMLMKCKDEDFFVEILLVIIPFCRNLKGLIRKNTLALFYGGVLIIGHIFYLQNIILKLKALQILGAYYFWLCLSLLFIAVQEKVFQKWLSHVTQLLTRGLLMPACYRYSTLMNCSKWLV